MQIADAKRIVIKVGSSLLTSEDGKVRADWLASLASDVARLAVAGKEVIIVTSGAVALGRASLGIAARALKLEEKQAAAACGQILLVQAWRESLAAHKLHAAQVLLTLDDSENRRRYLNARNTLETLLEHRVIPVINENDTIATAELRFGDNDRLAARVAQMASADLLILLSDIDGLYTKNPTTTKDAEFVARVGEITPAIEAMAGTAISTVGTGGMITKIQAAKIAVAAGCHMIIAAGKENAPLTQLEKTGRGTLFVATATPISARKHWIAGTIAPSGVIVVDSGAADALRASKSLLPAGVKTARGHFERGDAVMIEDEQGRTIGKGLIAYNSEDTVRILGKKSQEIEAILGFKGRSALIHRDDLILV